MGSFSALREALASLVRRGAEDAPKGLPGTMRNLDMARPQIPSDANAAWLDRNFSQQPAPVQQALRDTQLVDPRRNSMVKEEDGFTNFSGPHRLNGASRYYVYPEPKYFGLFGPDEYKVREPYGDISFGSRKKSRVYGGFENQSEAQNFVLDKFDPSLRDLLYRRPDILRELMGRGVSGLRYTADAFNPESEMDELAPTHLELPEPENVTPKASNPSSLKYAPGIALPFLMAALQRQMAMRGDNS